MTEPLWRPDPNAVSRTHLARFIDFVGREIDPAVTGYEALYRFSIDQSEAFWSALWDFAEVRGERGGARVTEGWPAMPGTRWFPDARLNFAENLLRRDDDGPAILFAGEGGLRRSLSWRELNDQVARTADALRALGIQPGDRVAGYLPNMPETIIAMLAAASLGAIWSSCSPDFGVQGVVDRFGQIEPRVLFAASSYRYNGKRHDLSGRLAELLERLPTVERLVVVPFADDQPDVDELGARAVSWPNFSDRPDAQLQFERLPF
ncbi:MAG: AMP-binding protein, partial [Wenzhouxiangellaceae bacterium]|nr:AMP-binding protein [Wenzhouxiangellaceae bacterium]